MSENEKNEYLLLSDEPILGADHVANEGRGDQLKFKSSAEVLARAALYTDSPITIGIFGNWGSGKTSLMRLMHEIVNKEGQGDNAAVAVWFNAWQYEREEHLIIPLIATIVRDMKNKQEQWQGKNDRASQKALKIMKDGGKKVYDSLRSVLYGISMKGKLGVPSLGELEISASMKDMIERYEAVTQDTLMARSLYFDAFDQLSNISHSNTQKPQIVVFIDDLDRCFPEQAVRLLESVKLVLHQPKFSFVLGIYPQIVEEFIRNKYAAQYPMAAATAASDNSDEFRGRMNKYLDYFNDYLGKIVQVKYSVPKRHPGQMHEYILQLLTEAQVTEDFLVEGVDQSDLLELIAEVGKRVPREIVRRINGLIVKWRIAKSENSEGKTYDLLAGLINETITDKVDKSEEGYEQFLHLLGKPVNDDESVTYGKVLAEALKKVQNVANHGDRIGKLKEGNVGAEDKYTMDSLILIIEKDEHLANVLNSTPGLKWLSDRIYREELRETYRDDKSIEETMETTRTLYQEELPNLEVGVLLSGDPEYTLPGLKMVQIHGGEFDMGSDNERPVHKVKLDGFEIAATPVTQTQYEIVMGVNPSNFKGNKDGFYLPVENVSWKDAMAFCEQLTKMEKRKGRYTLPTEAQWEYACRAGTNTRYFSGDKDTDLDKAGWHSGNSQNKTHPVREKMPNKFGLYDMHGNVWEWCFDWYGEDYYKECEGKVIENPTGPKTGSRRVLRGGGWFDGGQGCRSAYRDGSHPGSRYSDFGFRLVFVP